MKKKIKLSLLLIFLIFYSLKVCAQGLDVSFSDAAIPTNTEFTSDLVVQGFTDIIGMQFTIEFDPSSIQFVNFENINLSGFDISNYNTTDASSGIITVSWTDGALTGVTAVDGSSIFSLRFLAIGANLSSSELKLSNSPVTIAFVDVNSNVLSYTTSPSAIAIDNALSVNENELDKNLLIYPNPVSNSFNIKTKLLVKNVEFFNHLGQKVLESKVKTTDLSNLLSGLYFVKVNLKEENELKILKIIKE